MIADEPRLVRGIFYGALFSPIALLLLPVAVVVAIPVFLARWWRSMSVETWRAW